MVILSRLLNPVKLKPVLARLDAGVEQMDAELAGSIGGVGTKVERIVSSQPVV